MERDELLAMDDEALEGVCVLEFTKGTGPGGQHRNKSSTAVRLTLEEFGISVGDCSERSQLRNRKNALHKLRMALALEIRVTPSRGPARVECSMSHPEYPRFAAALLDVLDEYGWDQKGSAAKLGCTPSALVKLIARDPLLWKKFGDERLRRGLKSLKS